LPSIRVSNPHVLSARVAEMSIVLEPIGFEDDDEDEEEDDF